MWAIVIAPRKETVNSLFDHQCLCAFVLIAACMTGRNLRAAAFSWIISKLWFVQPSQFSAAAFFQAGPGPHTQAKSPLSSSFCPTVHEECLKPDCPTAAGLFPPWEEPLAAVNNPDRWQTVRLASHFRTGQLFLLDKLWSLPLTLSARLCAPPLSICRCWRQVHFPCLQRLRTCRSKFGWLVQSKAKLSNFDLFALPPCPIVKPPKFHCVSSLFLPLGVHKPSYLCLRVQGFYRYMTGKHTQTKDIIITPFCVALIFRYSRARHIQCCCYYKELLSWGLW